MPKALNFLFVRLPLTSDQNKSWLIREPILNTYASYVFQNSCGELEQSAGLVPLQ